MPSPSSEPFAEKWCLATEPERWAHPIGHSHAVREFYDAFSPRFEEAIDYCDKFPLDDVPEDALNLLHLIYSMIMVSMAVEVFGTRNPPTPPTPSCTASAHRCREDGRHHESADDQQAHRIGGRRGDGAGFRRAGSDDALGTAILDALEDNGVLVFPGLGLDQAQVAFCRGDSARSTTRPTATIRSPASTR